MASFGNQENTYCTKESTEAVLTFCLSSASNQFARNREYRQVHSQAHDL